MNGLSIDWQAWRRYFAARSARPLPAIRDSQDYAGVPASVARSLAIFQLGESGGGTIVAQARHSRIASAGEDYAEAVRLFVNEEHRHAEILAICVRYLGGTLIRRNWTARLFVRARRLVGLRLKVLVLLAAEVVGLCYYHLLATRLPEGRLKSLLGQLVIDERSHLYFHCSFLRAETAAPWRRAVFIGAWRTTMLAAALAVMLDHRAALRDLGLSPTTLARRWITYSRLAERLVTGTECTAPVLSPRCAPYRARG